MLGVEDYGSDAESDNELTTTVQDKPSSSKPLPLPKVTKKGPKKITIALPALSANNDDDLDTTQPPLKKARLESGAGVSSLLSMLPAPKQKTIAPSQPVRVLGGGTGKGLDFTSRLTSQSSTHISQSDDLQLDNDISERPQKSTPSITFVPTSLKGRANVSLDTEGRKSAAQINLQAAPAVDFFSLGSVGSSASSSKTSLPMQKSDFAPAVSSAPSIPTFEPPEPTREDEYPGYYQLPSGAWAAHDPAYYATFTKKWQKEYDAHVRALEKGQMKGFEQVDEDRLADVNAMTEMEKSRRDIKDREDKKALTIGGSGEPAMPKMNVTAAKQSGIARSRHQLSTLLSEAYQNREALEERIAEGRRNRKEAGNKYGF